MNALIQKIKNRHGSKSGLMNSCKYFALRQLGSFRHYENIDFSKVHRLVFICAGNICRSPLAEVAARSEGFHAVSYGLLCRGGDNADPRAASYAKKIDLDLDNHITQNIESGEIMPGDLIVGMEPAHLERMQSVINVSDVQFTLAGLWLEQVTAYIHDPYSTNNIFFEYCEGKIVASAQTLAKKALAEKAVNDDSTHESLVTRAR